jgi:EARP and GARP complex-interacting protein 1
VRARRGRLLRFWDLRAPGQPLKSVHAHRNHWATAAAYNRFHDQLLATAGSDASVCLWRVSSLSAAPAPPLSDDGGGGGGGGGDGAPDVLVRAFGDCHEDSVSALAWSARDPWVLASLGADGRAFAHHVPAAEKYKILL